MLSMGVEQSKPKNKGPVGKKKLEEQTKMMKGGFNPRNNFPVVDSFYTFTRNIRGY